MDSVASRSPLYLELPDQLEYVFTANFMGCLVISLVLCDLF